MPRMFFHSHLACFGCLTVMWLCVVYTFIRAALMHVGCTCGYFTRLGFRNEIEHLLLAVCAVAYAGLISMMWRVDSAHARWLIRRYAWIGVLFVVGGFVFFVGLSLALS